MPGAKRQGRRAAGSGLHPVTPVRSGAAFCLLTPNNSGVMSEPGDLIMKKACLFAIVAALALPALAEEKDQSLTAEYKQISGDFDKAQREFAETYQKTPEAERKNLKFPDVAGYSKKMIALAEKDPKSSAAADALVWALRRSYYDQSVGPQAIALLKEHHIENEKIGDACQMLAYNNSKENREFLNTIIEKNPHDKVKGAASLALGQMLANENPTE